MTDTWDEFIETQLIELAKKKLLAEGWTPPAEKQEPEFKEGDYVLVKKDGDGQEYLGKYHFRDGNGFYFIQESGIYFSECHHAPSWLKPESGLWPEPCHVNGHIYKDPVTGKHFTVRGKKWYWLPLD